MLNRENLSMYFPSYCGSGNRGCQAIIEGTAEILSLNRNQVNLLTRDLHEDKINRIDNIGELNPVLNLNQMPKIRQFLLKVIRKSRIDRCIVTKVQYKTFLQGISENSVMFAIGGDLYCYPSEIPSMRYANAYSKKKGAKTILWGCSIEKKYLDRKLIDDLKHYDCVYVRESISKKNLEDFGISENVVIYPDPAFALKPIQCDLPLGFIENNTVGINISNFTNGNFETDTIFYKNVIRLIDYILENTTMNIALIPHVFWDGQDDRVIIGKVFENYKSTSRVFVLASNELSYTQIRYVISKCRFFIGARTHSIISAYSTNVPALALGYSVKAKGIARDIGINEKLVVDCKNINKDDDILNAFLYMKDNEEAIKEHYEVVMPEYIQKVWNAKEILDKLYK